jgi:arylsulfatase
VHRALAGPHHPRSSQRRHHAHHRLVHDHPSSSREIDKPDDREIDGIDQLDWLTVEQSSSARDGYLYWMGPKLYGIKWRNFKLALVAQKYSTDPPAKLSSPRVINLVVDPHERESINAPHLHSWTVTHFNRLLAAFHASIERERPIPSASPLDHTPERQ